MAGILGAIGFFGIMDGDENTWLCEHFGCHVTVDFIWFLVTPLCAYYIYEFYLSTHSSSKDT